MTSIPTLLLAGTVLLGASVGVEGGFAGASDWNGGKDKPSPLKSVEFQAAQRVPYEIEIAIGSDGPASAWLRTQQPMVDLLSGARYEMRKKELWIHFPDRPRPLKVKGGKKPTVVEFSLAGLAPDGDGRPTPVLFYTKQDRWFAAPASMVQAKTKLGLLEILDVDLDGVFGSENDSLAWRGERFRLCGPVPVVHSETGLHLVEFSAYRGKPAAVLSAIDWQDSGEGREAAHTASLLRLPASARPQLPSDLDPDIATAWHRTNEIRNQIGLEPLALDMDRVDAAMKHAKYLQLNAPSRTSSNINVHDEIPGAPGFTPEGLQAAGGNVKWSSAGYDLDTQPDYEFATLFHRSEFIYPSQTMGAGADGGYSVVWVENGQSDNARWLKRHNLKSRWVMVPGPGQSNVPRRAKRDSPTPASQPDFYQSQRGWPISVATSHQYGHLTDVSLRLFDAKGNEVEGFPITMGDAGFGASGFQAHYLFAAAAPLESETHYRAEFRARLKSANRQIVYSWDFETSK
jgi:hypothetical protein